MPTKREMGYRIFRASGSAASSGASKVGGTTDTSSTVRYGTAVADSSGGRVQVKLDNSDSVVNCTCDTLIYEGDRVTVIVTSTGLMKAIPIGQNLVDYTDEAKKDLLEDITNKGNEILESVSKDIAEVNKSVDDAVKRADDLASDLKVTNTTVSDLATRVDGVAENATEAMTAASSAQQDLNGFKTTVTQTYQTKNDADDAMAQEVLARNTAIEQSATQIKQTVSQNYQSKSDAGAMEQKLQSQITQNADNIATEVTNRTEAVSGAVQESKTYTDQKADVISQTVENNVMNKVGDTYATKTELTQTSSDLTLKISSSIASGYATCTTAAGISAKVATTQAEGFTRTTGVQVAVKFTYANTAGSPTLNINGTGAAAIQLKGAALTVDDSWEAGDTVVFVFDGTYWQVADPSLQIAKTVSSYFKADMTGLEVGREGDPSSVKMASTGRFQTIQNGEVTFELYEDGGTTYLSMPGYGDFQIRALTNLAALTNAGFRVSTLYNGFAVNTERGVQVWSGRPSSTTADCTVSPVFLSYTYSNVQYVVIYYHGTFGSGYRSIKVPVTYGETVAAYLTEYARGSDPTSVVLAIEGIDVTVNRTNISISRGATSYTRANIATSVGVNGTASSTFRIDKIAICC